MNLRFAVTSSALSFLVASPAATDEGEVANRGSEWKFSWSADNAVGFSKLKPLSGSVHAAKDPETGSRFSQLKLEPHPSPYGQLEMGATVFASGDRSIFLFFALSRGQASGVEEDQSFLRNFYNEYLISEIVIGTDGAKESISCNSSVVMTKDSLTGISCSLGEITHPGRPIQHLYIPLLGKGIYLQQASGHTAYSED